MEDRVRRKESRRRQMMMCTLGDREEWNRGRVVANEDHWVRVGPG